MIPVTAIVIMIQQQVTQRTDAIFVADERIATQRRCHVIL